MEVIRGRERDCRQEIRGQARRGGTRSTQRVDSQRQAFRPAADEGETYRMRAKAGATAGSPRRWTPASPLSSGPGASWSEEGFEAVLARKYNSNSARRRIFDGAAGAKLIALTLSPVPEGFARWSLRLLEEKVVELHIVERASDNTIGRTLKKTFSSRIASSNG